MPAPPPPQWAPPPPPGSHRQTVGPPTLKLQIKLFKIIGNCGWSLQCQISDGDDFGITSPPLKPL